MRSHARLTYTRVWQALGENDADALAELADVLPQLEQLHQLYKLLAKARQRRGAIDFDSHEVNFRLSPSGEVVGRFRPQVTPEDPALVTAIEAQLPS